MNECSSESTPVESAVASLSAISEQEASTVWHYHQISKHAVRRYADSPGFLDWNNQPEAFRHFSGSPKTRLPLYPSIATVAYPSAWHNVSAHPQALDLASLSLWLELSFGISAWKTNGVSTWALRNNPSSGNLHPTETYLLLWRTVSDELRPGLYHYDPREHALERRATLPQDQATKLQAQRPEQFGLLGITSIHWREAWKYGVRAFRYCQHDIGHAVSAARLAAGSLGWRVRADFQYSDQDVARLLGLNEQRTPRAEWEHAGLLAGLGLPGSLSSPPLQDMIDALVDWQGCANTISEEHVEWPDITRITSATEKKRGLNGAFPHANHSPDPIPHNTSTDCDTPLEQLIRGRRSVQRMNRQDSYMGLSAFSQLMHQLNNEAHLDTLNLPLRSNLVLFVHNVEGLAPGLYALIRESHYRDEFVAACSAVRFTPCHSLTPELDNFYCLAEMDLRKHASQISCYQAIAGHSAFSLAMISPMGHFLEKLGSWGYRAQYWEAGHLGQLLYMESETLGCQGTGIGCFFDDEVHGLLGLPSQGFWQDIYHFTVGRGLQDNRLMTLPAYEHRKP